ncbi:multiple epidermal growth factor-like domains protein 6 isoform X1 [Haliotis rufescens]|uniref:multiple epidermal growth factor-like domains protein 6 isoform X1 n=1 Tax=Haliotis rufescens TaxID=6454 RepID=UPI00201EA2BE|nr:multiple epidermal growth factor-like domains protein 6 isoform X1 [Haliotis rufescens]
MDCIGNVMSRNLRHFKTSVSMLCLAFIVLIIRATPCCDGQNCRECDNDGDGSTQCERGYFGKKCTSKCNIRCQYQSCELTTRGIETCTEGCVPGFQGTSCNIPCDNPGTQCTECEGGCDGGYCMLNSSCISGCVGSYSGLDCKNCSERCKSCNRSSGICDDCHAPYRGLNCEMSCENCAGSCESGCEGGCQPGFYGHWCDKVCSVNCRPGPNEILECDRNTSINCTKCNKTTGDCVVGCNAGWYGKNCSSRCNPKCSYVACTESGACVDGCAPGYAGTNCSCYENCFDHVCHSENGTCAKGCDNGYYGAFCNNTCEICVDGVCDRKFGFCNKGCNITHQTCKSTCRHDCPIETCLEDRTCSERTPGDTFIIGTSTACVLCLAGIIVAIRIAYGRHCAKREETDGEEVECPVEQLEARDYELIDIDSDRYETGPVIVFL